MGVALMRICWWAVTLILLIGAALYVMIVVIEEDPRVQQYMGMMVHRLLEQTMHVRPSLSSASIRFITGTITVHNVRAHEPNLAWWWYMGRLVIRFSWWHLLRQGICVLQCIAYDTVLYSRCEGGVIGIQGYIQQLFASHTQSLWMRMEYFSIHDGYCTIEGESGIFTANCSCTIPLEPQAGIFSAHVYQGNWQYNGLSIITALNGLYETAGNGKGMRFEVSGDYLVHPPDEQRFLVWGNEKQGVWQIQGTAGNGSVYGTGTVDMPHNILQGTVKCPVPYLQRCMPYANSMCDGSTCTITFSGKPHDIHACTIDACLDSLQLYGVPFSPVLIHVEQPFSDSPHATIRYTHPVYGTGVITSVGIPTGVMSVNVHNETPIHVAGHSIPINGCSVQCTKSIDGAISGSYVVTCTRPYTVRPLCTQGTIAIMQDVCTIEGSCTPYQYRGIVVRDTGYAVRELCITTTAHEPCVYLTGTEQGKVEGTVQYTCLSNILDIYGLHMPGKGKIDVAIQPDSESNTISCDVRMDGAVVRLPYTYNVLENFSAHAVLDYTGKVCTLTDAQVQLHKGMISISSAVIMGDASGSCTYAHIPVLLQDCLISPQKDIFALISGMVTIQYQPSLQSCIRGYIEVDRAHIRSNIFSAEFQKQIMGTPARPLGKDTNIALDIRCATRAPMQVKTTFLEAGVRVNAHLSGTREQARTQGTVEVAQGAFLFPYKPLFITRGFVYWTPNHLDDPLVDIIAEGSIKGYEVRMQVSGSLKSPHISFTASPHLLEEQIIGLLWGGSEDGSLYLAMSTSVMQSIERIIFGPADATSRLQKTLQNLFRPLGNIRLVPSFTDQSGRGGLRASLAIEVDDRLRGTIKQNFDLPQDTLLEVEYALSDDARVRAFKDERGDVGAELEGRWKF